MAANWYYKTGLLEVGPITPAELAALAARGKLPAEALVRKGDDGKWIPAARAFRHPATSAAVRSDGRSADSGTPMTASSNAVRNTVIVVALIVVVSLGGFLVADRMRDRWDVTNFAAVASRLEQANSLKRTDGFRAFTIYEEVLQEASRHTITDEDMRRLLEQAAHDRDGLVPVAQARIKEQERRAAEEVESRRKIAEEEERNRLEAERAVALVRQREVEREKLLAEIHRRALLYAARPKSAVETLKALKRVQARVQVGVTKNQFTEIVGDASAEVNVFVNSPDGKELHELSDAFSMAILTYQTAVAKWSLSITKQELAISQNRDLPAVGHVLAGIEKEDGDRDLNGLWSKAEKYIAQADELLDPDRCESALKAATAPTSGSQLSGHSKESDPK